MDAPSRRAPPEPLAPPESTRMSNLDPSEMSRRQQMVATYRMTKRTDRRLGLVLLGTFLVAGGLGLRPLLLPAARRRDPRASSSRSSAGCSSACSPRCILFGRRAQKSAYYQMDRHARRGRRERCRRCAAAGRPTRWSRSTSSRTWSTASSARRASCWSARATPTGCKTLLANEERRHARVAVGGPDPPGRSSATARARCRCPSWSRHVTKLGKSVKGADAHRPAQPAQGDRRQPPATCRSPRVRCRPA